jgi:hypothetical protein
LLNQEQIYMSVLNRIQFEEISAASYTIWSNREIANKIAIDAFEIISNTSRRKFAFFTGKKSKFLMGGLFYLLGYRYNDVKLQRELAKQLTTTDMTIRHSYRQWLEAFPDLFLDVIGKFAADDNLKYFVLLDLDHATA